MDSSIERKIKNYKTLIILVIILIICMLGFMGFYLYKNYNNPKKRFVDAVSNFYEIENIKNAFNKSLNMDGFTYLINGSISSKYNKVDMLKIDLDSKIICDVKSDKCYYDINTLSGNQSLLDFEGIYKESKMYFRLKNIFKQFYYIEMPDLESDDVKDETIYKIINMIKETFNEYLTEDKFISTNEVINIDNKDTKVKKINLTLTEKDLSEIEKKLYTKMYNDEELLNKFVTDELTIDDIKGNLQDLINESSSDDIDNIVISYDIYLQNKNILKQEIKYDDIVITIDSKENNNITIKSEDEIIATGYFNKNILELNMTYDDANMKLVYTISNDNTNKGNINITSSSSDTDLIIDLNYEMQEEYKLPDLDTTNSKSIYDITEEEKNEIFESLFGQIFPGLSDMENLNFS